jgi:2-desacetyl-2-hydroxyethyl bacteriochlorophyllide A dehydrogenase
MRAMAVVDYDRPLEPLDLPVPEPGPGEVLVHIRFCGLCYSDVKTCTGHMPYSSRLRLPHVAGHEIAGELAAAGPGTTIPTGQRVAVYNYWACGTCRSCRAGEETICLDLRGWVGFTSPGGFQEYLVVPERYVLPLPASIAFEQAAALSCATGTSYRAVVTRGRVAAGESVLVVGTGGVGLQAVQVARAAGGRVFAADVDSRKLERARELGAETPPRGADSAGWLREVTDGGADLVIEAAGKPDSLALASESVRLGGRVVLVGYTVGERYPIPSSETVLGEISYIGSRYVKRDELARAVELVASGAVTPALDEIFELADANRAIQRLVSGEACGRIVLRVG